MIFFLLCINSIINYLIIVIFATLCSRYVKKAHEEQSTWKFSFYYVWKEITHKPSKVEAAKSFFPVYVTYTTCFGVFYSI